MTFDSTYETGFIYQKLKRLHSWMFTVTSRFWMIRRWSCAEMCASGCILVGITLHTNVQCLQKGRHNTLTTLATNFCIAEWGDKQTELKYNTLRNSHFGRPCIKSRCLLFWDLLRILHCIQANGGKLFLDDSKLVSERFFTDVGAFTKLRKATNSPSSPSAWNNWATIEGTFMKFNTIEYFSKICRENSKCH